MCVSEHFDQRKYTTQCQTDIKQARNVLSVPGRMDILCAFKNIRFKIWWRDKDTLPYDIPLKEQSIKSILSPWNVYTASYTAYNNVFINGTGIVERKKKLGYLVFTKHREKRKLCYFLSVLMAKPYRRSCIYIFEQVMLYAGWFY